MDWLPLHTDPLADAAAMYAAHGWQVFPCKGKVPVTSDGFKAATAEASAVKAWWDVNATANIGWPLPSGWVALDVDPRHGGTESLRRLEREHGPLPFTLRQTTGSGGEHWIYRIPPGVEVRQLAGFRPGLDTRVSGRGYLLISPSVHPETGKAYRWHTVVEPVELPEWLACALRPLAAPPVPLFEPPRLAGRDASKRERYAKAALVGLAKEVAEAGEGERNDTLNRAWFRIAQFRDVIGQGEARAALLNAALSNGLTESEATKVLR